MEIEHLEIRDYLAQCPPMDTLDPETLDKLIQSIEISYARRGTPIIDVGDRCRFAYLIRTGAVEILNADGELHGHYSEGEWIGVRCLLRDRIAQRSLKAMEDCLLYLVPADVFLQLLNDHVGLLRFFSPHKPDRLREAMDQMRNQSNATLISTQVEDYVKTDPLILAPDTSIQQAAVQMHAQNTTALLVAQQQRLTGIVTEREFCTKVVAQGMDVSQPVASIMTPNPFTIDPHKSGAEAMLLMARKNIRHVPVVENGQIKGLITATDLLKHQSHNAVFIVHSVHKAKSLEKLQTLSKELPATLVELVNSSLTAYDIGHAISAIGEAITVRLLKMAEETYGPPPVPYAWILAGSLSRNEQTAHSDQDNALILADSYHAPDHGDYFERLAQFVSDGLNACGYDYCPGNVMASNPQWRQPLAQWQRYFDAWINTPEPKALMYTSIFFDLRCAYGDATLLGTLQQQISKTAPDNSIFLAYMAANALQFHPPLGLFRKFVLEKGGAEEKALNFKKRGVTPVIDLARVYALACGSRALSTQDRLEDAADKGVLHPDSMADLRDAFEFISTVRLQHQARQIENNQTPDNFVSPEQLSSLERRHLKDAFEVVRTLQEAMKSRFHAGNLG